MTTGDILFSLFLFILFWCVIIVFAFAFIGQDVDIFIEFLIKWSLLGIAVGIIFLVAALVSFLSSPPSKKK